ncbi:spore germination lipoprotein GerD [Evansella cellulosilytica]|uniref:Spore germination protein GerD n=1 Tax=Evansella cellulosilytica (strain ATCC 21833 / DSM 2522 / FERM P-1141 / JCM 9156 / N-4) TaxID=649639 RepID=E6TTB2_EVAC2|nr:spore germination lipoprotein GerD [Evansella cellulosilytica]ADU28452.1 spore germination protein GerD [Evansella cellulosilytica DSM 2522]
MWYYHNKYKRVPQWHRYFEKVINNISLKKAVVYIPLLFILLLNGCAAMEDNSSQQPDYESTKKMMVDMLKTDEGKQAIQDVLQDEEVRQNLVMEEDYVKQTIQTTLTSDEGKEYWQRVMQDPEFAKSFAESIQSQNEKMMKSLMKDPEYQGMMMDVLKDPEMEEKYLELMQSKEYRQQVMTVMQDAFESPYFVAKLNDIFSNVAEEQMNKQDQEQQEEGQDSGESEEE